MWSLQQAAKLKYLTKCLQKKNVNPLAIVSGKYYSQSEGRNKLSQREVQS